jgi:hypothetical protein
MRYHLATAVAAILRTTLTETQRMRTFFTGVLAALVFNLLGIGFAAAQGSTTPVDCRGMSATACEAAQRAVAQGRYRGPQAPTQEVMACVRVVMVRPADNLHLTEVVWTRGTAETFRNDGMVIARQRPGAANIRLYPGRTDLIVVESCIPQAWLVGVSTLTLCNGTRPNEGYHWQVHQDTLRHLQGAQRHPGTFLPLLPTVVRDTISPAQARDDYARYMRGEGARLDPSTLVTTPPPGTAVTASGRRVAIPREFP